MMQANVMQQAQAEVHRLTGAWRGGPPVTVVATPADLPVKAPSDARGLFRKDGIWLVASTQPVSTLADAVNHEAVAHFGLRQLYGRHWKSFMQGVRVGVRAGDCELLEMQCHVHRAYGQGTLNPLSEADEIAAATAENWTRHQSGRIETRAPTMQRAKAAWGFIAREALYLDQPVTGEQLQGALLEAQHRIRYGGAIYGVEARLRRWYAPPMAFDPYKPPMSIAESERMLKSERDSDATWDNVKFFFMMIPIWLLLGFFVFGLVCAVIVVIRFLS